MDSENKCEPMGLGSARSLSRHPGATVRGPSAGMAGGNIERPASEVEREMLDLEGATCETHTLLEKLAKRLAPVLADRIENKDCSEKDSICQSAIGRAIRGSSDRVKVANYGIAELLSRITL